MEHAIDFFDGVFRHPIFTGHFVQIALEISENTLLVALTN